MSERIQISQVLKSQIPNYVRDQYPTFEKFLEQYYIGQEYQGGPLDLIQNIDKYVGIDALSNIKESVYLLRDVSLFDSTIHIDPGESPTGTIGFPDSFGLLKIDDEVITYRGKTAFSFTGCIRGFSGITKFVDDNDLGDLTFEKTKVSSHERGAKVENLSVLFLKEMFTKMKYQFLPGLENKRFADSVDENLFLQKSRDFYAVKGTRTGFELLFKLLYGEKIDIISPKNYIFTPSNSNYELYDEIVLEVISGDPEKLNLSTLYQDPYKDIFGEAFSPITVIEKISDPGGDVYYKARLDSGDGSNRDIGLKSSISGSFTVHPKTKVIGDIPADSTVITVDSTIGFPNEGELYVVYEDQSSGSVTYTSKSFNQFFGCSNVTKKILDSYTISINTFAYAKSGDDIIQVRVNSIPQSIEFSDENYGYHKNLPIQFKTLGYNGESIKDHHWAYNNSAVFSIDESILIDQSDNTYQINLKKSHYFREGDSVTIIFPDSSEKLGSVSEIVSDTSLIVRSEVALSEDRLKVRRNIHKSNNFFVTDVQNVYKHNTKDQHLIASSSIPSNLVKTEGKKITFSGTFAENSEIFKIVQSGDHGFYTGDAIYYKPEVEIFIDEDPDESLLGFTETEVIKSSIFEEGLYFIKRISATEVKFSLSLSNIDKSKFISLNSQKIIQNNTIEPYEFRGKSIGNQLLARKLQKPEKTSEKVKTGPGFTGILINGTEILNYKSQYSVNYGKIEKIDVISNGFDYDIINPPNLVISDQSGQDAEGFVDISGSLEEIQIIDPGFDYQEPPIITIVGGNGVGAKISTNMKKIIHSEDFNSLSISTVNNTIGFSTYHKFKTGESVLYKTNDQQTIGGISNGSVYYVSVQDNVTVLLHETRNDAISGINVVSLTSTGNGYHSLESTENKQCVESFNIISSGINYQNKKRIIREDHINLQKNSFYIENHRYTSGEYIKYFSTTGTAIGGLVVGDEYVVTAINSNEFTLSYTDNSDKDIFYKNKQYVNLTSYGSGDHIFNCPEIQVKISSKIGIPAIGQENFEVKVQPIFKGQVESVYLSNNGHGYGSSEIVNYNRTPDVYLDSGLSAQASPVVNNGEIVDVIVLNQGRNYTSTPNLRIVGEGSGAVLTPIVENGFLREIKVVNSGFGYSQETFIIIESPGQDAKFNTKIQSWNINLFEKNINNIEQDDVIIANSINDNYGLQCSYIYAPRLLRESLNSIDSNGNEIYGSKDLRKNNNKEIESADHSPIIGWAYDGNPIYGPYGYSRIDGGSVVQMKSGYRLDLKPNRPPTAIYPDGFFVEDYTYFDSTDEDVLDENNGRFCVTPDFPEGTYAYFSTVDAVSVESSGKFIRYKKPQFPYLIGDSFNNSPIDFNFEKSSNQTEYVFNNNWARNTSPYNLDEDYEYLDLPDISSQRLTVDSINLGSIESIVVKNSGDFYRVGDKVIFDNIDSDGENTSAEVFRIKGKSVNEITSENIKVEDVEISSTNRKNEYIITSQSPHNLENNDIVSVNGLSNNFELGGVYTAKVNENILKISEDILDSSQTGIVTQFNVVGNLSADRIRENDILQIDSEKVKVLNVHKTQSKLRVLREYDNTVGAAHSMFSNLSELSRKLTILSNESCKLKSNKEFYFSPSQSLGLGSGSATLVSTEDGDLYVPPKSIYLKDHGLVTGDSITYNSNGGDAIVFSEENIGLDTPLPDGQNLFVARISKDLIGISTVRVGLDSKGEFVGLQSGFGASRTLYFEGVGLGENHSFVTNYDTTIGNVSKNEIKIKTETDHGLSNDDEVFVSVNPKETFTFDISYNETNRRLVVDKKSFVDSDFDLLNNTIKIQNHNFSTGDKVIYTSANPSDTLESDRIYYIVVIDPDTIALSNSYSESNQNKFISVNTPSSGNISSISPKIKLYRDSTIVFNVSDESLSYLIQSIRYSAFRLDFYIDNQMTIKWQDSIDDIKRVGRVGIDPGSTITLEIDENCPDTIFYKLTPIFKDGMPDSKRYPVADVEILGMSTISVGESNYNGKYKSKVVSNNEIKFGTNAICEKDKYTSNISDISYETSSLTAQGPISKIIVTNPGKGYKKIPKISEVESNAGINALLEPFSSSIGKINNVKISDLKKNYPSDETLRPTVSFTQILKVDPLYSVESISLTDFGKAYLVPPKLIVKDLVTDEVIEDLDLEYEIGNSQVSIIQNTHNLSNAIPSIIPIHNNNGIGISTISYDPLNHDTTIVLSTQYSDSEDFPIKPGDKFLVESTSVEPGGIGFNSEDYNYKLFTAISTIESIGGGYGSISYSMSDLFGPGENAGIYDTARSFGRIIPESYFPKFDITLVQSDFLSRESYQINEEIKGKKSYGSIQYWEKETGFMHIISNEIYDIGSRVKGSSSKAEGTVISSFRLKSHLPLGSSLQVRNESKTVSGFLNNDFQRLQDSDYYQNFSYSVKSRIPYETWNDDISPLTHVSGFKKFSDYQIESTPSIPRTMVVGISSGSFEQVNDLIGKVSLNSFSDFDLVSENDVNGISNKIIFNSKVLGDYSESVGNRVLEIDDLSSSFDSSPRSTNYSTVAVFNNRETRYTKFITLIKDRRYTQQRQITIVDMISDNFNGYINQYARVETEYDLGSFDYTTFGNQGLLNFYPERYEINNYDVASISFNLGDTISSIEDNTIGSTLIRSEGLSIQSGTTKIFELDSSYTSMKLIVQIDQNPLAAIKEYHVVELNIINDGSTVHLLELGKLTTNIEEHSDSGFGTFDASIQQSKLVVDFTPHQNFNVSAAVINTYVIALEDENSIGSQTEYLKNATFVSETTSIPSSANPQETVIAEYDTHGAYDAAYAIIQITDSQNNKIELNEFVVVDSYQLGIPTYETYNTTFGTVNTDPGTSLGNISSRIILDSSDNKYKTQILFTPSPNISTHVNIFMSALRIQDDNRVDTSMNGFIGSYLGSYTGTSSSVKKEFELTNNGVKIFERTFDSEDALTVNLRDNLLTIENHFFVSGEPIKYQPDNYDNVFNAIEIEPTSFSGIGVTDRLPTDLFAVKVSNDEIQFATSAKNALKFTPEVIKFKNFGVGTSHKISAKDQNGKALISVDNVVQSPIVSTTLTTLVSEEVYTVDDTIAFDDITGFYSGDLIRIGEEIMRIDAVGIQNQNLVRVRRDQMGTKVDGYPVGTTITKITGNFNIVNNTLHFIDPPYGKVPISNPLGSPEDRDWDGIGSSSTFNGRIFLRSGMPNTSQEPYSTNYVFDDISDQFDAVEKEFILKSEGSNISGIENGIILINGMFQYPNGVNFEIESSTLSGLTTMTFSGQSRTITNDVGISSFPKGGQIVSVGSSEGFGYQPLITAGGSASLNANGEIDSISIGNSGSGYRSGFQVVNVSVRNSSNERVQVGTADVVDGRVTGVTITNPGSGYLTEPEVIFDSPLGYSDLPLVYSNNTTGTGVGASISVVVGQESRVIDFSITNSGHGYKPGDRLTVPITSSVGIQTNANFTEFIITVDRISTDKFSGWTLGELEVMDNIEPYIDGEATMFPLLKNNKEKSILAQKGSDIVLHNLLIIFVNSILQVPGKSYVFNGGSMVEFREPLKEGDTVDIMFYKGSGDEIDVIPKNVIDTVKTGDDLQIVNDPSVGQSLFLKEDLRIAEDVRSTNIVLTNPYYGPGNVDQESLLRPITWTKQTEDRIINDIPVGKDRELYEPAISPIGFLLNQVGVGQTTLYVDNVKPAFDPTNESVITRSFQKNITLIAQDDTKVEDAKVLEYSGDYGVIVGFGVTSNPTNKAIFDLYIPEDSILRDASIVGTATTVSQLSTGDYFCIHSSNVNADAQLYPLYSYNEDRTELVGITQSFVDSVFVVHSAQDVQKNVNGVSVAVRRVFCNIQQQGGSLSFDTDTITFDSTIETFDIQENIVSNSTVYNGAISTAPYMGEYSWGKIILGNRTKKHNYTANILNGYDGISSSTLIKRSVPLQHSNYSP